MAERLSRGRWRRTRHLEVLSHWLADAAFGQRRRIMVLLPPRHGKSELASHWFPVWFLSLFRDLPIILASYEADFAAEWGRKVRGTIDDHAQILQQQIAEDSSAAHRWNTQTGGSMVTAGVGGAITGRGARLLVIDDPVKNWEQAHSPTSRAHLWDWWQSTAYTRLEPGGIVVLVMSRWHQDDFAGRLLREMQSGGETWDVLALPAIAEAGDPIGRTPGEALWADRYDRESLARIRRVVDSYVWAALYQQQPSQAEGELFPLSLVEAAQEGARGFEPARWYCPQCRLEVTGGARAACVKCHTVLRCREYLTAWDLARKRDWMVGITVDRTETPAQIVAFSRFRRVPWPEAARRIEARAEAYPGTTVIDSTGVGDPVMQFLKVPVEGLVFSSKSKTDMIQSLILIAENGEVRGPKAGEGIEQLWREMGTYRWDDEGLVQDCVVTLAMIAQKLRQGIPRLWVL